VKPDAFQTRSIDLRGKDMDLMLVRQGFGQRKPVVRDTRASPDFRADDGYS
jgi:hypothetical protein